MEQNIEQEGKAHLSDYQILLQNSQKVKSSKIYSKISNSFSMEIQQLRIPEQLIIIKDEGQKALISSIICPICLLTLPLPYYQCQQCNNSFCPDCIESWWGKNPNSAQKQCIFKCENATFKKVKRSNTYIALMDVLQFKCGSCSNILPLSSYEKHQTMQCPQIDVQCSHSNCKVIIKRKNIEKHEKQCEFRLQKCKYCNQCFLFKDLETHEQKLCPQKTVICKNKGCQKMIKIQELQNHHQNCEFKLLPCEWCTNSYLKSELLKHEMICQSKKIQCEWCQKVFKPSQFQEHICDLRQQICKLCQKGVIVSQIKQHRNDCMFQNMLKIKQQNSALLQQNKKLHYKINELQEIIEDFISNSQGKALQVMQKFKMKEKRQLQKDLERIHNSMSSINKLRDEEINKHTEKIRHLFGYSLCPQCKFLEKKFMDMKEPLLIKRRQILQKIQQIDKFYETAKGQ